MKKSYKVNDNLIMRIRKTDESIMEWASVQSELGDSIRFLIEQEIQSHGISDLSNQIVSKRKILPNSTDIEPELLKLLQQKKRLLPKEAYEKLAEIFQVTAEERKVLVRSRNQTQWHNNCQWARQNLVEKGYLDPSEYGVWKITQAGETVKINQ